MRLHSHFVHQFTMLVAAMLISIGTACTSVVSAVSPETITLGKQLFENKWTTKNPSLHGNDGLGPLFNASSCVGCHHQGGVGGGGAAEFNAKSISIEKMEIRGHSGSEVTKDVVRREVSKFHPGFIDTTAGLNNSLPLAHHGGSPLFSESRDVFLSQLPVKFSRSGGPVSPAEVRRANETPITYLQNEGPLKVTIQARMFQRNTTSLFGAGLIDKVTDKQLRAVERAQKNHPEISSRLSTLATGRLGRFGWRSNVPTLLDFCDKACAAEVGLKTKRIDQPSDPTSPNYRNPSVDITDAQIRAMADFVAALPAPTRDYPSDSEEREMVLRGEQVFNSVGCAVCHLPNLGHAKGIYSDLLLHDMGRGSYDLNPADPYITRLTPVRYTEFETVTTTESREFLEGDTVMGTAYYGGRYSMEPGDQVGSSRSQTRVGNLSANPTQIPIRSSIYSTPFLYRFEAQPAPPVALRIINPKSNTRTWTTSSSDSQRKDRAINRGNRERTKSGADTYSVRSDSNSTTRVRQRETSYVRAHIEPTYFTQEWRTPPLWGVRDSAPYMHDGRAETLLEAITMHGGESDGTRSRFLALPKSDREAVVKFLETMVAPKGVPQANLASQ